MYHFSVHRPVTVSMLILAVVILGLYLGSQLNIDLFPKLDIPIITVTTQYLGVGPEEIEEQISKRVEDAVGTVGGIKTISSTSMEGVSTVVVEFEYGTNLNNAANDIREKIDGIRAFLPQEAKSPVVSKMDPAAAPIVLFALSGTMELREMRTLADDDVKKDLEEVSGVASVRVSGGLERQVRVVIDRNRLEQYGISPAQVTNAVRAENINVPGGRITKKNFEIQVRSVGEFASPREIEGILVGSVGGRPIFMRDIAKVYDINKEKRSETRLNGVPCVTVSIQRNTDANTVLVAEEVRKKAEFLNRELLPPAAQLSLVYDNSKYIRQSIDNMWEEAFEGGILAVLVIFVFLGSVRATGIISLSLPTSIIGTFLLMFANNLTINMITLSGFIMGIGRIVDDSIVVLENIFRHIEMGKKPMQAAIDGAQEVGLAIMASTFTTISVFMPLFLVGGLMGQMFSNLSKTFAFSLLCSLGVAVTLIPMLSARVLHNPHGENGDADRARPKNVFSLVFEAWERLWGKIENLYRTTLGWALSYRFLVLIVAFGALVLSFPILGIVGVQFSPKMDHGNTSVIVDSPVGSSFSYTDSIIQRIEKIVKEETPELECMLASSGLPASGSMFSSSSVTIERPDQGSVNVFLIDKKKGRTRSTFTLDEILRERFAAIPGADIRVQEPSGFSGKAEIEVLLRGDDLAVLAQKGLELKKKVAAIRGAADLTLNWKAGNPEYRITLDRVKAAEYGLNLAAVSGAVRTSILGQDVTKYKERGKEFDITVQLPGEERATLDDLQAISIPTSLGVNAALRDVATVELTAGPSVISRRDRSRCIILQGSASGRIMGDVIEDIRKMLPSIEVPTGYSWDIGGQEKDREENFNKLWAALALGIIFVYVILASQFESFIHPFTIMLAIPLELVGVFLAMLIFREPLSIIVILGMIMLTGIVVSNSILLVNYIIVLRGRGKPRNEAVLEAGPVRLRPILMTALATVIAMIPMAMGVREGQEFFAPLGKVVIGGLLTSTFFTLLVVPAAYTLIDDLGQRLGLAKKE